MTNSEKTSIKQRDLEDTQFNPKDKTDILQNHILGDSFHRDSIDIDKVNQQAKELVDLMKD